LGGDGRPKHYLFNWIIFDVVVVNPTNNIKQPLQSIWGLFFLTSHLYHIHLLNVLALPWFTTSYIHQQKRVGLRISSLSGALGSGGEVGFSSKFYGSHENHKAWVFEHDLAISSQVLMVYHWLYWLYVFSKYQNNNGLVDGFFTSSFTMGFRRIIIHHGNHQHITFGYLSLIRASRLGLGSFHPVLKC